MACVIQVELPELEKFGIAVSTTAKHKDKRGDLDVFFELDHSSTENFCTITKKISSSKPLVFRGLHIQTSPFKQKKISRVIEGEILQVFLNLDINSPEFGQSIMASVAAQHDATVTIPDHFAHGFFAPTGAKFEYICLGAYSEKHEISIAPDFLGFDMILSEKDANGIKLHNVIASLKSGQIVI